MGDNTHGRDDEGHRNKYMNYDVFLSPVPARGLSIWVSRDNDGDIYCSKLT